MSLSIYIHIPFCIRKCGYCDFVSSPVESIPEDEYTVCVIDELRAVTESLYDENQKVTSIYFGGGTPTLFSADNIGRVIAAIRGLYDVDSDAEVTLEANPKTADHDKLCAFRDAGVNRLSIGAQSFDDGLLKLLGRMHSSADTLDMYDAARRARFDNINLDLIFGVPTQTGAMLEADLNSLTRLDPEHVSAYILTLEKDTALFEKVNSSLTMPHDELTADMFRAVERHLAERSYEHYEISAYAKAGNVSRHNLNYWRSGEYIGLGAAAHSMVKGAKAVRALCGENIDTPGYGAVRWWNVDDYKEYMDGSTRAASYEPLDEKTRMAEFMIMGLRLLDGIKLSDFKDEFGKDLTDIYDEKIKMLTERKLIEMSNNSLKLTRNGVLLANEVLINLI